MKPLFFSDPGKFRKWLEENHDRETELLVGFYKVGSGKPSMTWPESVDQALCFGWIDGIRHSINDESYSIRFTPRRSKSGWSAVNIKKMAKLKAAGLLHQSGIDAFAKRKDNRPGNYSYENRPKRLSSEFEEIFAGNETAWAFFSKMPPSYVRTASFWVMSAKKEETRSSRLAKLIRACENGKKLF